MDQDRNVGEVRSTAVIPQYLLAPDAYASHDWFEAEQTTLFGARWALVAPEEALLDAGSFVTATVGGAPLAVVRDTNGQLRAFHNMCRHRGMQLLEGSGCLSGSISCFYHQWRYGLDGSLEVVPQRKDQFPDLDLGEWGLLPASVATWEGLVFAHPDPAAAPLDLTLDGVADRIGSHHPAALVERAHLELDARCNWKLFVENHVDVYHLWYLHERSLAELDHTKFEWVQTGGNWASYEPLRHPERRAITADDITHLDDRDRHGVGAHLVFPNLMIAASAEFFATYVARPVAPDRSIIDLRIRAEPTADIDRVTGLVLGFITEDIKACEAIQRMIASPAYGVGPLAIDHERPIEAFHQRILAGMR